MNARHHRSDLTGAETLFASHAVAEPPAFDETGTRIGGRYLVLGLLGVGGMGAVYKATDLELDETVALKMLRRELSQTPGMIERFRQEVKLARRVTHKNVVRTFDLGEHGSDRFLTMEFVEGRSLARILEADGPIESVRAIAIVRELTAGMAAAHKAGVLHRDLKPDNILIATDGRVLITDFGIARSTYAHVVQTQGVLGTPAYMAPEQVQANETIDERADLYALGAILYEMLTGKRAWEGDNVYTVAIARLTLQPPDPRLHLKLPPGLGELVVRCMARQRHERPATADALLALLAAIGTHSGVHSMPTTPYNFTQVQPMPSASAPAVAVLPFTAAADDVYLAEGLTEEMIDILSMTQGLRVRPLSAVVGRSHAEADPRQVGQILGVDAVVSGSVRRIADGLRITARVISVQDGFQLWGQRFECAPNEALQIGDTVARAVADALMQRLDRSERKMPTDPEAVDLYLRGRHEMRAGWDSGLDGAMNLLETARTKAPDDPQILATYATTRARQAWLATVDSELLLASARTAADRAVQLGPHLGEPWVALATVLIYSREVPAAAVALRRALAIAPGLSRAQTMLGGLLLEAGRLPQAMDHLRAALSLDPQDNQAVGDLARAHGYMGDWAAAAKLYATPNQDVHSLVLTCITLGRLRLWDERAPEPPELPDVPNGPATYQFVKRLVNMYKNVRENRKLDPRTLDFIQVSSLPPNPRRRAAHCQFVAEVQAYIGQVDTALALIQQAVDSGLEDIQWLEHCPILAAVRLKPQWSFLEVQVSMRAAAVLAALDG